RRHTRSKRDWSSDVCSSDLASCCIDDVVKDFCGFRLRSFSVTFSTVKSWVLISAMNALTSDSFFKSSFLPLNFEALALKVLRSLINDPSTVQYSSGLKARISFSRLIIICKATDCTRPADKPFFTFFHNIGDKL